MDRKSLNYFIDVGLLISFLLVFATGIIKFPELQQILGINRMVLPFYEITLIHDWGGLLMSILVFIHLALHWRWIVGTTKKYLGLGIK